MKKKYVIFAALILVYNLSFGQQKNIKGLVKGAVSANSGADVKFEPLPGANVYWVGTTIGTTTGINGEFEIAAPNNAMTDLVVSYIGYENDTLQIGNMEKPLNIVLAMGQMLDAVVIRERLGGAYISKLQPLKTEVITSEGLTRLACCNLSESFENNATVDVGYSDAVSGAKQIKMLGLAGVYSQLLSENIPSIRGLATTYGLNYIPGSWMESIQISKGSASVLNGYESVTGQINVEFKKPSASPPVYVNLYANNFGKGEINLLSSQAINKKIGTMLMVHGNILENAVDNNNDGFLDMPKSRQVNIYNRWNFKFRKGKGQIGYKVLNEERKGGQISRFNTNEQFLLPPYEIDILTERYQVYAKRGFPIGHKGTSIGFMASASYFSQDASFGLNEYFGLQRSIYSNVIYQNYFKNPKHSLSSGLSYQMDVYDEKYNDSLLLREESVPGVFAQYTFNQNDIFNVIAGLRYDKNSEFGDLITPRLHFKWNFLENNVLRGSIGKGYRSANIFAENIGLLASSREIIFEEEFNIEEAWNYGLNYALDFNFIGKEKSTLALDFYRTQFENQIVVDLDKNVSQVHLYNLKGDSYSNSFQVELSVEPIERFEILTAFRLNDVKINMQNELKTKPFVNKHKGLVTFSYATNHDRWQFDLTNQFIGQSRLPDTDNSPIEHQRAKISPSYYIMHAQVARKYKNLEVYIGGENLTGFMQEDPIISPNAPYSDYFDTSFIWGPIMGRKVYAGIRFTIK